MDDPFPENRLESVVSQQQSSLGLRPVVADDCHVDSCGSVSVPGAIFRRQSLTILQDYEPLSLPQSSHETSNGEMTRRDTTLRSSLERGNESSGMGSGNTADPTALSMNRPLAQSSSQDSLSTCCHQETFCADGNATRAEHHSASTVTGNHTGLRQSSRNPRIYPEVMGGLPEQQNNPSSKGGKKKTLVPVTSFEAFSMEDSHTTLLTNLTGNASAMREWQKHSRFVLLVTRLAFSVTMISFYFQALDLGDTGRIVLCVMCFLGASMVTTSFLVNANVKLLRMLFYQFDAMFFTAEAVIFGFTLWGVFCFSVWGFFLSCAGFMAAIWVVLYDAFPPSIRQTMRWTYLLGIPGFSFIVMGVSLRYFKGMCFHRLDITRGLIDENDRTVWSFSLVNACLNAGYTVLVLALRVMHAALMHPTDCVVIQVPLRVVETTGEAEQEAVDGAVAHVAERIAAAEGMSALLQKQRKHRAAQAAVSACATATLAPQEISSNTDRGQLKQSLTTPQRLKWRLVLTPIMPVKRLNRQQSSMTWILWLFGGEYQRFWFRHHIVFSNILGSLGLGWYLGFLSLYPYFSYLHTLGFAISNVMAVLVLCHVYGAITNCALSLMIFASFDAIFIFVESILCVMSLWILQCPTVHSLLYSISLLGGITLWLLFDAVSVAARRKMQKSYYITMVTFILILLTVHFRQPKSFCLAEFNVKDGFTLSESARGANVNDEGLLLSLRFTADGTDRSHAGVAVAWSMMELCLTSGLTVLIFMGKIVFFLLRHPDRCTILQSSIRLLEVLIPEETTGNDNGSWTEHLEPAIAEGSNIH